MAHLLLWIRDGPVMPQCDCSGFLEKRVMKIDDYFVKTGYVHNLEACSFDKNTPESEFWTEERLQNASDYQYYVYDLARKLFTAHQLKKVADVGCGPAVKTKIFFDGLGSEIALFDQEGIQSVAESQLPTARFLAVDLESCEPSADGNADLVICADVLEHLQNPVPCIEFCKSLVTREGLVIFSTPERDQLRGTDCYESGHPQHVREWNSREFRLLLESRGLVIQSERVLPAKRLLMSEAILRALSLNLVNGSGWKSCQVKVCRR